MGQLVANERGYLLATGGGRPGFWFSVDGVTWRESEETGLSSRDVSVRVAATQLGFYAWEDNGYRTETSEPVEAVFSADGRTWSAVQGGPGGWARQIVSVGDRLLGMDADPDSGTPRLWVGIPARGGVAWLRDTEGEASFRNAAPSTLVTDAERVVAFGWNQSTEQPLVWTQTPTGWQRSELPAEDFGGIPRLAAAGPEGFVVVGSRPTSRGMNPTFWHSTDLSAWAPERSPILPLVPDAAPDECGPPPRDAVEYMVLDRAVAMACFGDQPITFRAWANLCEGCYGSGDGTYETEWLQGLTREQLFLSPVKDDSSGWWTSSPVHPSLEYDESWTREWLEVTGHFNDPAATECRWTPSPAEIWYYEGRDTTVYQCRQQFVVTEVTILSGP
jgi:hypothetical protein